MRYPGYFEGDVGKALKWAERKQKTEEAIAKKFESSFGGVAENRDDVDMLTIVIHSLKKRIAVSAKEAQGFLGQCPVCRAVFRDKDKFCYNCGQKIEWSD